jgi:hypothetical protein
MSPVYNWTRFWVPHTGVVDLSDFGFLRDPTVYGFGTGPSAARALPDMGNLRALALLGEPGIGKSNTLKVEAARIEAAADPAVTSIYVDLRAYGSEAVLLQKVFQTPAFLKWKEGDGHLVLHLDSLDEALLRVETVGNLLAAELREQPVDRLSIRIACRTAVWPSQTLGAALSELWGPQATGVFELVPLRRRDVLEAAAKCNIEGSKFIEDLIANSAVPFAIKPLTLNMLLGLYQRDGHLPASTIELYTKGCLKLCEEQNPSRRETGRRGALNIAQRVRLAARIAAASMLCNRYAVWTGPEADGVPQEYIAISALVGGLETGEFPAFDVTNATIEEVLDTGLFSARGYQLMGWAHQGYAEFLAAKYLLEKSVDPAAVLKILKHPEGGLVPQLSTVAAWAASLDSAVRAPLLASEPMALLAADLTNWQASELSALTTSLLEGFAQKRINDFILGLALLYRKLKHPGLAAILRPYLLDKGIHLIARRAAVMIARACETTELLDDLVAIALDPTDDPGIRARAVVALPACGGDSLAPRLLPPLARGEVGPDPTDDIRGAALEQLWPNHLTGAELFALIVAPNAGYMGTYSRFLFNLPPTLKPEDLLPGLAWSTAFIRRLTAYDHEFTLARVSDAIMFKAWDVFDQPGLTDFFLENVAVRLFQHGNLCRGTDYDQNKAFQEELASNTDRRRLFLRALAATEVNQFDAFNYHRSGFVSRDDFVWLLSISPGGDTPDPALNQQSLIYLADAVVDWNSVAHGEALWAAAERWPLWRERYAIYFNGVMLDSDEVQAHYAREAQLRELREDRPPPIDPNPDQRVLATLEKFEAGDLGAFWVLNIDLTLTPTSRAVVSDLEFHINQMPGWETAGPALRQRILAAAEMYLREAPCTANTWLGTRRYQRPDFAGWRAFLLLNAEAPAIYSALPPAVWERWAPAIVGVPKATGTEHTQSEVEVYRDAYTKAQASFIAAMRLIIKVERAPPQAGDTPPDPQLIFLILRELPEVDDLSALLAGLFDELLSAHNTPEQFAALLDVLLQHNYEPARHFAESVLTGPLDDRYCQIAAVKLMRYRAAAVWPALYAYIVADQARARTLFLDLASHYRFETPFYAGVPEDQLADLYILLERLFPRSDIPDHPSGKAHYVGPLEQMGRLRDGLPRYLVASGTRQAVSALRRVAAALPQLDWLPFEITRAEEAMRVKTWAPLNLRELFALTDHGGSMLISSADELRDLLVTSLRGFEAYVAGQQTPVRGLWDLQADKTWRPVEENAISDVLKLYLERELRDRGIIANREVEVSHIAGSPVGDRTDIRVDAVRKRADGRTFDVISAIIEIKGCWNAELFTGLTRQLYGNYMIRLDAPVGIYLVMWFDKNKWDKADYRRDKTPNRQIQDVLAQLKAEAAAVPISYLVAPVVMRCPTP